MSNVSPPSWARAEIRALCIALGCMAALWLAAINLGTFGTPDTDLRLRMAHAWWSGEPEVNPNLSPPASREQVEYGVVGAKGERLIFYEPGQSWLMVPSDWVGAKLSRYFKTVTSKELRTAVVVWTLFLPINVAVVLAAFWLLIELKVEPRLAALSTLVWLLGTTVLPYAQVAFQNNQVLLCVLVANAAVLEWSGRQRAVFLIVSGVAAGSAMLLRATSAIHVATIGLFLIVVLCMTVRPNWNRLRALGWWTLGFVPLAILGRVFDHFRYGGFLTTGQSLWISIRNADPIFAGLPQLTASPFTNPASDGILGVLFSPAKSILLYDPLLLPCLLCIVFIWKRLTPFVRWYIFFAGLNLVLHIGLTSRMAFWHGDGAWAARYHVTSVQLLLLPILPYLVQAAVSRSGGWAWPIRLCIALAVATQAIAVAMPYEAEIAPEYIATYPNCDQETWETHRGPRLEARIVNLYCVLGSSRSALCEDPPVVTEAEKKPLCEGALHDLRSNKRLAFFPYNPTYALASRVSWIVWALASVFAFATTLFWCRGVIQEMRAPRPRSA